MFIIFLAVFNERLANEVDVSEEMNKSVTFFVKSGMDVSDGYLDLHASSNDGFGLKLSGILWLSIWNIMVYLRNTLLHWSEIQVPPCGECHNTIIPYIKFNSAIYPTYSRIQYVVKAFVLAARVIVVNNVENVSVSPIVERITKDKIGRFTSFFIHCHIQ